MGAQGFGPSAFPIAAEQRSLQCASPPCCYIKICEEPRSAECVQTLVSCRDH